MLLAMMGGAILVACSFLSDYNETGKINSKNLSVGLFAIKNGLCHGILILIALLLDIRLNIEAHSI